MHISLIKGGFVILNKEIQYIEKCNELNLNYIGWYYSGHDNCVQYTCNKHLDKGILHSAWTHLKRAKYGCKYCIGRGRSTEDFKQQLGDISYEFMSDYIGFEKPITCKCNICDNIWTTTPASLSQGCKCPKCSIKERGIKSRMSHEDFLKRINPNIEILSQYQGLKIPVKCRCKICNYTWSSIPDNLIYENVKCPGCLRSKQEIKLGDILEGLNMGVVKSHVRFEDCKNIKTLEFDYVVYTNDFSKILFACEYDGEGHFHPTYSTVEGTPEAKQRLSIVQQRDKIKDQYCLNHKIPLIRIPYWEKDNMESFLLSQYKEICKETLETAG